MFKLWIKDVKENLSDLVIEFKWWQKDVADWWLTKISSQYRSYKNRTYLLEIENVDLREALSVAPFNTPKAWIQQQIKILNESEGVK
jgi:hypothetical protein